MRDGPRMMGGGQYPYAQFQSHGNNSSTYGNYAPHQPTGSYGGYADMPQGGHPSMGGQQPQSNMGSQIGRQNMSNMGQIQPQSQNPDHQYMMQQQMYGQQPIPNAEPQPSMYHQNPMPAGLQCSWHAWPPTKADAHAAELPLAVLYTPFEAEDVPVVNYDPIRSRQSGSVLCPYAHVDFRGKMWTCPFSMQRNPFPPQYAAHVNENNLPLELTYPTCEYILAGPHAMGGATFIFVIDTCLYDEEFEQVKDSLQQVINMLNPGVNIGIITYGTNVNVYSLGFHDASKCYVFKGTREVKAEQLQAQIRKQTSAPAHQGPPGMPAAAMGMESVSDRLVIPLGEGMATLNTILEDIQTDNHPVPADQRSPRCTGAALSAACAMMEAFANQQGGRVILFTGGICTSGPGQVADPLLSSAIRHHIDLVKETAATKHTGKAIKFYQSLAQRALQVGHSIDIFACSLDQVGLHEMRVCTEKTGGVMVMSDTFSMHVFKDSLRKLFEPGVDGFCSHAYNAKIEIFCSKEVRVCGAIGCCSSTGKKGSQVGDLSIGDESATCEWSTGAIDKTSSFAFYLEVANTNNNAIPSNRMGFLQFHVTYKHPNGQRRKRVTTVAYPFAQPGLAQLSGGFNQEVAAVVMARLAVQKAEQEDPVDILRWLDRKLIRFVAAFADYQKEKPETFQLSPEFALYPQFMFHLRRSQFLQTFNASPDETAYYRLCLLRETYANSLVMIQPSLIEYTYANPQQPSPVNLDAEALKKDVVLILDTFFHIVIWHGDSICGWKEQGYHEMPEYENLKIILEQPQLDAKRIISRRFPVPKFVICNAGGSQARFLLAKVNPSKNYTHEESGYGGMNFEQPGEVGAAIITDDVSLKVFSDHLVKLAVQS